MNKKCLLVTSVSSMVGQFIMPNIELLQSIGYRVTVATNFSFGSAFSDGHAENLWKTLKNKDVEVFNIKFFRNVFDFRNIFAYNQIKKLITHSNYSLIHCHSPIGGLITRLAAKKHSSSTKVIYTVHGFHFYKNAPIINWMLYYPVEKWLSKYTDILITMNREDYNLAKSEMRAKSIYYTHGVGINISAFSISNMDREKKRKEFNISADSTVIISVGELIKRKNHHLAIKALCKMKANNIYYIICGQGKLQNKLRDLYKKINNEHRVLFLGYRDDIVDLLHMSDAFLFPSLQEGLPVALMEAMAAGLPCIASNIRGSADLITDGKGGFLCDVNNINEYKNAIEKIIANDKLKFTMGEYNRNALQKFDIPVVMKQLKEIYDSIF